MCYPLIEPSSPPHLEIVPSRAQAPRRPAARRRGEIVHAATEIIARDGVGAFRVEDVGHRIGVAKTTIYRYFATRERLLVEAIRQITADHLRPLLEPLPPGPSEFRLEHFVFGLCQAAQQPSVQAVFGRCNRQFVIGQGEMVEADEPVAEALQRFRRDLRLFQPRFHAGQRRILDQPLMGLEPRHMGIAEQCQPLRIE